MRALSLREKKAEAIRMRKEGASYSQIKERIKISKSSLSLWLRDMPLSNRRIRELRDFSALRIERYRETRRRTREGRWAKVRMRAAKEIGKLNKRELCNDSFLYPLDYHARRSKRSPTRLPASLFGHAHTERIALLVGDSRAIYECLSQTLYKRSKTERSFVSTKIHAWDLQFDISE